MAEVRIEGFQEAVDEALGDVEMAGGNDVEVVEVVEVEDTPNGNEAAPGETRVRTTFIEYELRILKLKASLTPG
jgi:hypothetical protein